MQLKQSSTELRQNKENMLLENIARQEEAQNTNCFDKDIPTLKKGIKNFPS